ncbi:unnamed protein product [Clonostachys rosea f. rosea IK726]|uniref:Vegetative cell wall protein gp1 n=6 Tax=Clonostachys TaxID=110564 RepID=A0A0B7JSI6_BIOOC|nr:unnamed protein product [Clonostachys rosea f. rosea IK726]CAG9999264.1 unnamed protein product [Clonostachys byssicola]CAH0014705.1 unnamed protein product [Clonostachys rhizophaga]CAI6087897.1 unnamed protein product [Clonostachys chloroleuca]
MNNYPSPRTPGSTPMSPIREWEYSRMSSATPTPSPRPNWLDAQNTPRRPATRAAHGHGRVNSYSQDSAFSPRPPRDSPRYNSSGHYATVDVSYNDFSSRRPSVSHDRSKSKTSTPKSSKKHSRRHSFTYVRSSTPYGESDEDEIFEALGCTFTLPAQSRSYCRYSSYYPDNEGVWYTNRGHYSQEVPLYNDYRRDPAFDMPRPTPPQTRPPTSHSHSRRASASIPQRSSTVRPPANASPRVMKPPAPPVATEAHAAEHRIPPGFSLKNWDPREQPILLLGSVFDANSLGKWIYDWTVYKAGSRAPLAEMAGELWLLLLDLSEKTNRAEGIVGSIRSKEKKQIVEEFLDSSERLMSMLQLLLKNCEAPMLKASSKKKQSLGQKSGIEFVDTLFGRDRELDRTEKFMQKVRKWALRFDVNVSPILDHPTQ